MNLLTQLQNANDVPIYSVSDPEFASYGRILKGYDFSEWIAYMEQKTEIPKEGNCYVASVDELEQMEIKTKLENILYGGMPIQVGYCNGKNSTYNGFEYHKGSEINVAVTDFMLVLGHTWEIKQKTYRIEDAKVFFVEKGTAIEMYQTTLHLSPCKTSDAGFRDVVVLPRGTNTPLTEKSGEFPEEEAELLLQKNKWVIAHPQREPLIRQGAFAGLLGENKQLFY